MMLARACLALVVVLTLTSACRRHNPEPLGGHPRDVRFTAHAQLTASDGDSIVVRVEGVNRARGSRMVSILHCDGVVALVSRDGRGDDPPRVWSHHEWLQARAGGRYMCLAYAIMTKVDPGASVETYRVTIPVTAVLGDTLPAGRYRVIVGADPKLKGGLSAGEVSIGY